MRERSYKTRGGRPRNRVFKVCVRIPDEVTEDEMMDYIEDAVSTWRGSLSPENPLFDLDPESVIVKRLSPKYEEMNPNKEK